MKKQQIIALFLSAVIGISACVPAPGISAFASEEGTSNASESVLSQNTDDTDTIEENDGADIDEGGAFSTAEGGTASTGSESTTANDGSDSSTGSTNAETGTSDSGTDSTGTEAAASDSASNAASAGETSDELSEDTADETTEITESASDAKALLATDPGGSFETAVEVTVDGTQQFALEDYGEYYLKFTPTESGVHTIYATSGYRYALAEATLLGSANTSDELAYNQTDFLQGDGKIFFISHELTAGHTYYILVGNLDVGFDMTIHVSRPQFYARACEVEYIQTVGRAVTLKVEAESALPLTYEWHKKNGEVIPEAVTNTYTFTPLVAGARTFTCTVSDGLNTETVSFHFNVADFVDLTAVNENVTADYGTEVELQTAVDSPYPEKLTYQWRDADGKDIAGAVSANYTVTVTKNTTYSCVVNSPYGAYDFAHFNVKVNSHLFAYAGNAGTDAGGHLQKEAQLKLDSQESVTLNVLTDSTDKEGLTYQWYRMKENSSNSYPSLVRSKISGATSKDLYLETPEAGTYICQVTDAFGNTDSASFELEICGGLTVYPKGAEETADGRENFVYFDADASEQIELCTVVSGSDLTGAHYSWYVGSFNDPAWTAVDGAQQDGTGTGTGAVIGADSAVSTLTVSGNPEHSVRYKCVVKDAYGNYGVAFFYIIKNNLKVTSPNGTLAFDGYYKYTTTVVKELEEPLSLRVNVDADDISGIEFGWFYFAPDNNTSTILSGSGNRYRVTADKPGFYECRFTDAGGNSRCVEFKIVIDTGFKAYPDGAPTVDGHLADRVTVNCEADEEVTLSVRASSSESWEISYAWFDPNGNELTEIGDSRTAKVTPVDSGTYTCKVDDGYGNVLFAYFDIVLDNGLSIVPVYNAGDAGVYYDESRNELTYSDVAQGASVKLRSRVTADDITGLSYEWRERELYNQNDWTRIDGAGSGVLTVKSSYDMAYSCRVTDRFGTSQTVYFVVKFADTRDLGIAQMILSRSSYVCDMTAKEPGVIVRYKGRTLEDGVDYKVSYQDNVNAGTATVTATAVENGRYTGSCSKTFTIKKTLQPIKLEKYVSRLLVDGKTQIVVTGVQQSAKVSFSSSDKAVAVVDKNGIITAKGQGAVEITVTVAETDTFAKTVERVRIAVVPGVPKRYTARNWLEGINLAWSKVPGATKYSIYRNGVFIRTVIGSASSFRDYGIVYQGATKTLVNGTFYTYKIQAENEAGKSTKVRYASMYRLDQPRIVSVRNKAKRKAILKWTKNKAATGYIIEYSTRKSFDKNVKSITTKVNYPQKTILKLLKGRTYYFRVRSYRKYRGKKYYSAWSPVKTLKVKK